MQNKQILRNLVALSIIPGLGARRLRNLVNKEEQLEKVFNLSKSQLRSFEGIGEASTFSILSFDRWEEVDAILSGTKNMGAEIITITDTYYPELLKQIYDPPLLFWMKGNPEALNKPGIAVIGTRNPTPYGKKQAHKLSYDLASKGLNIFSGLAYGIDAIAHKAALEADSETVAVLGSGIDNLYPKRNVSIANEIIKNNGAVISEFPLGTNPDAGNFPVRNRIVSGMSLGVLIVESGIQGGSMITAELGLDQNREVFAVPHSLENVAGSGGNYLIKRGAAKLVQTVDDILEELPVYSQPGDKENDILQVQEQEPQKSWKDVELDDLSRKVCELLEIKPTQIDDLGDELGVSTSQLLVCLLQLEMRGIVSQKAGKIFSIE